MNKKFYMYFLAAAFILGITLVVIFYSHKFSPTSVGLPLPKVEPTITPTPLPPTPTVVPQLIDLERDLKTVEQDLPKVKEEKRLNPPVFIFDLGVGL